MVVAAAVTILEGERDYDEQTLATPTLQRSNVHRGVVHPALVNVKGQGVDCILLNMNQTSCLYVHQKHVRAHQENHGFGISLFGNVQDRIYQE